MQQEYDDNEDRRPWRIHQGEDSGARQKASNSRDIPQPLNRRLPSYDCAFDAGGQNAAADTSVYPGADPHKNAPPHDHQPGHRKQSQDRDDR